MFLWFKLEATSTGVTVSMQVEPLGEALVGGQALGGEARVKRMLGFRAGKFGTRQERRGLLVRPWAERRAVGCGQGPQGLLRVHVTLGAL